MRRSLNMSQLSGQSWSLAGDSDQGAAVKPWKTVKIKPELDHWLNLERPANPPTT